MKNESRVRGTSEASFAISWANSYSCRFGGYKDSRQTSSWTGLFTLTRDGPKSSSAQQWLYRIVTSNKPLKEEDLTGTAPGKHKGVSAQRLCAFFGATADYSVRFWLLSQPKSPTPVLSVEISLPDKSLYHHPQAVFHSLGRYPDQTSPDRVSTIDNFFVRA